MLNKVPCTDVSPYSSSTSSTECFKIIPVLILIMMLHVLWSIDTLLTGKWLLTFESIVLPIASWSGSPE